MLLPYNDEIKINEGIRALSQLMFGRTIAAINNNPEFDNTFIMYIAGTPVKTHT